MRTKEMKNVFLLSICVKDNVVIGVIDIEPNDVNLMKQLITDIYENETGGITIRLKLKTNYAL